MFSFEYNGYNKKEVDNHIASLKSNYERALMDEKLKVLEAEKKMLDMKKKYEDVEKREKNIMTVLDAFKKMQAEGSRNIEVLRGEQLRAIYTHLQTFLNDLSEDYPGILVNSSYKKMMSDIEEILASTDAKKKEILSAGSQNDAMRMLLSKMQEKKYQDSPSYPKEVRFERAERTSAPTQIKPVCDMQLNEDDKYDNLVDKFLNTEPEEKEKAKVDFQSNAFDLKEAINPSDDLNEIMKAFDFFGADSNKPNPDDYDF